MSLSLQDLKALIKGGEEMASGIAHRSHGCHMRVSSRVRCPEEM